MGFNPGGGGGGGILAADSDVTISSPASNQALTYNSGTSKWQNATLGDAAAKNVGTTSGTVAAGDDSRIVSAVQTLAPAAVQASNFSATVGTLYPVDTTGSTVTVTLPTTPADGSQIGIKAIAPNPLVNAVTINAGGSAVFNKAGGSTSLTLTLTNQAIVVQYKATGAIWYVIDDSLSLGALQTSLAATYAPLNSPALTGNPTAPTQTGGDNSTKISTTAFVAAAIASSFTQQLLFSSTTASVSASGTWKAPTAGSVSAQSMRVTGASLGSDLVVQIRKNGTAQVTLTITAGSTTEATSATGWSFAVNDLIDVNCTSCGSTTAATGVVVEVVYT